MSSLAQVLHLTFQALQTVILVQLVAAQSSAKSKTWSSQKKKTGAVTSRSRDKRHRLLWTRLGFVINMAQHFAKCVLVTCTTLCGNTGFSIRDFSNDCGYTWCLCELRQPCPLSLHSPVVPVLSEMFAGGCLGHRWFTPGRTWSVLDPARPHR